jgi:predicted nucleotidyltransferase
MGELTQGLLDEMTRRLVAEFRPREVWLFGSRAWGDPTAKSDVDLLVVVDESAEAPVKRMQRAHRCLRGLAVAKDVLVQTRAEFEHFAGATASLTYKVLTEGRRLYG